MINPDKSFIDSINPSPEKIRQVLDKTKKIAVVGLSPKEERPSNMVARYLVKHGYSITPVNPGQKEVLGEKCFSSLMDIPYDVDMADLFISNERIPDAVDQAIKKGIKVIWMQLGVFHREACEKALEAGVTLVVDRCIKIEHERLSNPFVTKT
ncbi:MAG: CoA-binding protein [Desulfatiglans sp.]|jgi:predicted CoA-binding protein|nr:CoA-binding protein [Desulfatiglans sp.]